MGVTKQGVGVGTNVFVGPPGVFGTVGVNVTAGVGQGRKQPSGGQGLGVRVGHPAGGHGVKVGGMVGVMGVGVTVINARQGVCVGGGVLVGPPGVFVTVGVPGVGVGHGIRHPSIGHGVAV